MDENNSVQNNQIDLQEKDQQQIDMNQCNDPPVPSNVCTNCGCIIGDGAVFCPGCGAPTTIMHDLCPSCGTELNNGEMFCPKCGKKTSLNQQQGGKNKKLIFIPIAVGVAVCIVGFVLVITLLFNRSPNMKKVYESVGGEDTYYVTLSDDESSIAIDTNPLDIDDFSSTSAWAYVKNVNSELNLPDSLVEKMLHTSALDGRQSETYGKITVSWKYHPDYGLEVVYSQD